MNDHTYDLIGDLFEVNRRVSQDLWNVTNTNSKPTVWSPRVVFPPKRDGSVRVSEQEARIIYCALLNDLNLYYSVETPTEKTYIQKGKKKEGMSAQTDLAIYSFDGQRFARVINIEFKAHNCDKGDIAKDVEKLVREGITGNWFHILEKVNARTFPNLFEKFRYSFMKYPDEKNLAPFSSKRISILFCFCVLQKEQAYLKRFSYEPPSENYRDYVEGFFNPSQLNVDSNWHLVRLAPTANTKNRILESNNGPNEKSPDYVHYFIYSFKGKKNIVCRHLIKRAEEIRFRRHFSPPTCKDKYRNFPCPDSKSNSPVAFQIHRHKDNRNVALAIPHIDGKCPKMEEPIYPISDFEEISGHSGNNIQWLNGFGGKKWPFKPVKAFGLREVMADDFNSKAWKKVEELLDYALGQCRKRNTKA